MSKWLFRREHELEMKLAEDLAKGVYAFVKMEIHKHEQHTGVSHVAQRAPQWRNGELMRKPTHNLQ